MNKSVAHKIGQHEKCLEQNKDRALPKTMNRYRFAVVDLGLSQQNFIDI